MVMSDNESELAVSKKAVVIFAINFKSVWQN